MDCLHKTVTSTNTSNVIHRVIKLNGYLYLFPIMEAIYYPQEKISIFV